MSDVVHVANMMETCPMWLLPAEIPVTLSNLRFRWSSFISTCPLVRNKRNQTRAIYAARAWPWCNIAMVNLVVPYHSWTTSKKTSSHNWISIPIPCMYGIFTCIYHKHPPNVGKYTMHGWWFPELLGRLSSMIFLKHWGALIIKVFLILIFFVTWHVWFFNI